jgi:DHA1 family multidrug resistance protein-like MFS transporter
MRFGFHATRPIGPLLIVSVADTDVRVASASGLIVGVSMAAGALGAVALGRLGDRVHYRTVLIACALVSAAVYVAHGFVSDLTTLMLLQAMAAVAMSGILVSIFALLARAAPRGQEGAVYALDQTVDSGVSSIAPLAGSALAATRGLRTTFLFAGVAFGLASLVATWRLPKR